MGFFYSGGGERTVLNQAIHFQKKGHKVKVYAPTVSNNCFPELAKKISMTEICRWIPEKTPLRNALAMLSSSLQINYKELAQHEILIAHAQPSNWIAYKVNQKNKTPYISYLHQVNRFLKPREIDKQTGWNTNWNMTVLSLFHKNNDLIKKLDEITIKNANYVITNSNWIRTQIQQYYEKNSVICYPGVNTEKFFKAPRTTTEKYILTTNRHYPQKRIDYLLHVVQKMKKEYPQVKCKITGEPTRYTKTLMEISEKLDLKKNVEFLDKVSSEKLTNVYQNAYTYGYTSPEEDFGLGPVEAGACGVPSIVWDYAGPRETVLHNQTGFRVTPYKIDEMTEKHLQLFDDEALRNKMGVKAHQHIYKNYTWQKHCEKLERVIEKTVTK